MLIPSLLLSIPYSLFPTPYSLLPPPSSLPQKTFIRPPTPCPTDIAPLTRLLLRDVPDYGNRVSQRSRRSADSPAPQSHIITASDATFATLEPRQYSTIPSPEEIQAQGLESIFFTTLERQYLEDDVVMLQHYHWVFLADTRDGWALALMYSILGDYPETEPPSPPYNSSYGVIAQAIRLWLRDCKAGSIEPSQLSSNTVSQLDSTEN